MTPCIACGHLALVFHHCVYQQHLGDRASRKELAGDERNMVALCNGCHALHHDRRRPLRLTVLPDSVFEFAAEVLGSGPAWVYLSRRYAGADPRLDALLMEEAA